MIARMKDKDLTELLGRFKNHTAKKIIESVKGAASESRKDLLLLPVSILCEEE